MRSLLAESTRRRLSAGGKLLVPFLTAGFPDEERFFEAVLAVQESGADALEIGVPFSDPLADGPTIQRTSQRSLESGITLSSILDLLVERKQSINIPVVLMTYMNPVHRMGARRFCGRAADAGVAGILPVDLPPEEYPEFGQELLAHDLDRIVLIAPTTSHERIDHLVAHGSGFIYCVTRTGITGAGADFSERLGSQVERVRKRTTLPIVAGFGIRTADDVERLRDLVDGVVIGARLLEVLEDAGPTQAIRPCIARFLDPIRERLGR